MQQCPDTNPEKWRNGSRIPTNYFQFKELQRQLYKFKAQPSTFQVEGNKYNHMGNGIYVWNGYAGGGKKAEYRM